MPAAPPMVVSVSPGSGASLNQTFSHVFSDGDGWTNLFKFEVLINSTLYSRYLRLVGTFLVHVLTLSAQPQRGMIVAGGYRPPVLVVAPGQVITVYATGVGAGISKGVRASGTPWPTEMAGISVELDRHGPVRIARVEPFSTCPWNFDIFARTGVTCGRYVGITLQIPQAIGALLGSAAPPPLYSLTLKENGVEQATIELHERPDQIHFLRDCDAMMLPDTEAGYGFAGGGRLQYGCIPLVFHGNGGTRVSSESPAREGESLVIYAYGLGTPRSWPDGEPPPSEIPEGTWPVKYPSDRFRLHYTYSVDVQGGGSGGEDHTLAWDFLGPVPGQVGLFQLNFKVPLLPNDLKPCSSADGASNLGINLSSRNPFGSFIRLGNSADSVGICVDPGSAESN